MKKLLFFILLTLLTLSANAQKITYGLSLGALANNFESFTGLYNTNPKQGINSSFNYGLFADFKLKNKFSLKTDVTFYQIKESFESIPFPSGQPLPTTITNLKLSILNVSSKLKINFSESLKKGMYLEFGPRFSKIKKVEILDGFLGLGANSKYNSGNFGFQFGFGVNFLKYFSSNINFDYTISDVVKLVDNQKQLTGFLNLNIHLDSIFNN